MSAHQIVTRGVIVVADAALYYPVNIGSPRRLTRLQFMGADTTLDIFSRRFSWATALNVIKITSNPDGYCRIQASDWLPVAIGDYVTPALTGVGGYNAAQRVTGLVDGRTIDTDKTYSANVEATGTINLSIPSAEQPLYRLAAQLSYASGSPATIPYSDANGIFLLNTDPVPAGRGVKDDYNIYLKFGATGSFRVSMTLVDPAVI